MKIFLLISIDTECDKGPGWVVQKPMSFNSVVDGIPNILNPIFSKYSLKATYLLSPEILYEENCITTLKSLSNVELGTHLHGEFIDPDANWEATRTSTPQVSYSDFIEQKKLENLTNLFYTKFGKWPTAFRAGRWGISEKTLTFLEQLGYKVDSSVCPFNTHYFDNNIIVNHWGAPIQPYRPSYKSILDKGGRPIIEVPATLGNKFLIKLPRFLLKKLSNKSTFHKKVLNKFGLSSKISWLRPFRNTSYGMISLSEDYINFLSRSRKFIFLNLMFHSNEIIPNASPYPQSFEEVDEFIRSMESFFDYLTTKYEVEGIGLSDVPMVL